jgi:hypothetical protein
MTAWQICVARAGNGGWCNENGWQTTTTQAARVGFRRHNKNGKSKEEVAAKTAAATSLCGGGG